MLTKTLSAALLSVVALAACGGAGGHSAAQAGRSSATSVGAGSTPATATAPAGGSTPVPAAGGASPAPLRPPSAQPTGASKPAASPTPVAAGTVVTSWKSPRYGDILTGANGHVLYLFTPDDATGMPTCTGSCAAAWPPLMAGGATPRAAGDAQQSKLGVSNGQVTYSGHPLYYYAGDSGPDQTNGQGSGGIWYVLNVDGTANMS